MKKSTKLLSVILAILMIFSSLSVASFAAKANYKTVDELNALQAYNQYGSVTRLSTEERMSILFDALDNLLAQANINMGTVVDTMGLKVTINFTSVNNLCASLDSFRSTLTGSTFKFAAALVNLGILEKVKFDSWQSGMTREGTDQLTIVYELLQLLSANTAAVNEVFSNGIELGMIANFIKGLDLSSINGLITNIPSAVKRAVFPLMARPDTAASELGTYTNTAGDGGVLSVLDSFVKILFTKPMLWTSYRVNAAGADLGYTTALPTAAQQTSRYFVASEDGSTITQYDYNFAPLMGSGDATGTWTATVTYTKTLETEGGDTYVYTAPEDYTGDHTLKWYKNGDEGYLLPSVRDAINSGALTFSVNGADSALTLLYKFIPYVFAEMAPVVLNGSVKKLLAGALGVDFAEMTAAEVDAVKGLAEAGDFFTKPQEFYLWEYSDYKVIDGVPYYRFEDTYFKGTLPANLSTYYYMFNWDWKITDDFVNEFIPTVDGTTIGNSAAGYDSILDGLNAFVYKIIDTVLVENFEVKGQTYNLRTGLGWENGGLDKVVNNVLRAARYAFSIAPEEIFDEYYNDAKLSPYYNMMMNGTVKQALTGLACAGIKLLMPQAQLPSETKLCKTVGTDSTDDVSVLALGAVVVRELCTQLMPAYNFDALIYADYNTKTLLTGAKYDANYWLDTVLTMGVDLGMYYLRNITDLGEDSANGYYAVMNSLGAVPSSDASSFKYTADSTYINSVPTWQYKIDWIIDWALTSSEEWAWGFEKFVDCGSAVDLATYQDPWAKLNTVFLKLLPLDQVFNASGVTTASNTWLENILRGKLVNGINNFDLPLVASAFKIPDGILRNANVLTQVVTVVRQLLNSIFYKLAGNQNLISDSTYTTLDAILNQNNIKNLVVSLVGKLETIGNNGLLVPVLPIAGMFVGWKTGIQEYSDPSIYFHNNNGDDYLYSQVTNTLNFVNNSAGMLQKHRNSDVVDTSYTISISNIEADNGVTFSGTTGIVEPGATASFTATVPATDAVTQVRVTYSYIGKDGKPLGGEQTKVIYARIATTPDVEGEQWPENDQTDWKRAAYNKYIFTTNLYKSVLDYNVSIVQAVNNKRTISIKNFNYAAEPSDEFKTYFSLNSMAEAWNPSQTKDENEAMVGHFWKAASGVTASTQIPYGYYDAGSVYTETNTKYLLSNYKHNDTWTVDFIYYSDFGLTDAVKKYVNMGLLASDFVPEAQAAYDAYDTALRDAVYLVYAPKTESYYDEVVLAMEEALTTLNNAYDALSQYDRVTETISVDTLISALDNLETNKGHDIDFEDHELYEYFQYENARTAARKIINAYAKPAQPESYIDGENLSQAVIEAIANANSGNIKTGIDATVSAPSAEAMKNWNDAIANWTDPTYSDLEMADAISRLNYYYAFMDANWRNTVVKDFLNQEISIAEAQGYKEADYSADSWAAYTKALADAKAVQADAKALQSAVFDAKYELMKAQNDLLPKYASMKDNGYLDGELATLIEQANTIVGHFNEYFKVKDGVDATEAWKQLVKALGVEYNVKVDGTDYTGILYNHSALTFKAYDRLNSNKEKAKVDAACDKLQAALNNFVSSVTLDKNDSGVVNQVTQDVRYIQGIVPGTVTTAEAILNNVKASNPAAKLAVTPSKSNGFGTGATVKVSVDGIGVLSTYYVVVYGDVNGDGVVDAFDAFAVDKNVNSLAALDGVYEKAADADASGAITVADLTPIMSASVGNANVISQTR